MGLSMSLSKNSDSVLNSSIEIKVFKRNHLKKKSLFFELNKQDSEVKQTNLIKSNKSLNFTTGKKINVAETHSSPVIFSPRKGSSPYTQDLHVERLVFPKVKSKIGTPKNKGKTLSGWGKFVK